MALLRKMELFNSIYYKVCSSKKAAAISVPVQNGNPLMKVYDMDFSDIAKHYKVYYPPEKDFADSEGLPTALFSNLVTDSEFNQMCDQIDPNWFIAQHSDI